MLLSSVIEEALKLKEPSSILVIIIIVNVYNLLKIPINKYRLFGFIFDKNLIGKFNRFTKYKCYKKYFHLYPLIAFVYVFRSTLDVTSQSPLVLYDVIM